MADEFNSPTRCKCSVIPVFEVEWRDAEPMTQANLRPWIEAMDSYVRELAEIDPVLINPISADDLWDDFKWVHDMTSTFQLTEDNTSALLALLGDESWAAWNFLHDGGDIDGILEVERAYEVSFE